GSAEKSAAQVDAGRRRHRACAGSRAPPSRRRHPLVGRIRRLCRYRARRTPRGDGYRVSGTGGRTAGRWPSFGGGAGARHRQPTLAGGRHGLPSPRRGHGRPEGDGRGDAHARPSRHHPRVRTRDGRHRIPRTARGTSAVRWRRLDAALARVRDDRVNVVSASTVTNTLRVLQFGDSMFPVGAFAFSGGLEMAVQTGVVRDRDDLAEFTLAVTHVAATGDGIALLAAHRGAVAGDLDRIRQADEAIFLRKVSEEARTMTVRMGRKLAELATHIIGESLLGSRI